MSIEPLKKLSEKERKEQEKSVKKFESDWIGFFGEPDQAFKSRECFGYSLMNHALIIVDCNLLDHSNCERRRSNFLSATFGEMYNLVGHRPFHISNNFDYKVYNLIRIKYSGRYFDEAIKQYNIIKKSDFYKEMLSDQNYLDLDKFFDDLIKNGNNFVINNYENYYISSSSDEDDLYEYDSGEKVQSATKLKPLVGEYECFGISPDMFKNIDFRTDQEEKISISESNQEKKN